MRPIQKVSLACCTLFIFGCATGKNFITPKTISSDKATIYLYKPKALFGAAGYFDINITNKNNQTIQKGRLENGGFLKFILKENIYNIHTQLDIPDDMFLASFVKNHTNYISKTIKITPSNKTITCYKFRIKNIGINSATAYIENINTKQCLHDLKGTKESEYF